MDLNWGILLPPFIRSRVEGSEGLRKILGNTGWLFADKIVRLGIGLLVGVWVARYLGPEEFGVLNYATAFVTLFSALATVGLDGIVVRELLRSPAEERFVLGSTFAMKLAGGTAVLLLATLLAPLVLEARATLLPLVVLVAAGMVFQAFDAIDFWFQARVQSRYTVMAKNGAFLLLAFVRVALILLGARLLWFGGAVAAEAALGALGLLIAYRAKGGHPLRWRATGERCRSLLRDSWPLILSGVSVMLYLRIGQVLLGSLAGQAALGVYSAAVRVSEVWYFIPMAIVPSVFPAILRTRETDEALYYRRLQRLFSIMAAIAVVIAVPMTFLSTHVIALLFGDRYREAGPVLAIHIWAAVFFFLGVAQSPWDVAENMTRLSMARTLGGALVSIALNLILIPRVGIVGSAIASVASHATSGYLMNALFPATRRIFACQTRAFLFLHSLRRP